MYENRFNEYRIPSGMLIVFLEKALTLIHMETHLDDVSAPFLFSVAINKGLSRIFLDAINSITIIRRNLLSGLSVMKFRF